ncbi:MAG: acetyl-CoA carboxylase biotin carboxyl carrier protein [Candidatus Omnitrophica bacterium]|nr:acetyl-CoA carboxylase biotin carboxyl carrier protein [Candidatus Omnitrophota bacterium]MBU1047589.1 acetyl-CoA carboxylase biotin carboxyl carrier protein [Candidatus Omnitrophota bacterium]MBU1766698.1 acetyl-CoA carboxylase biotin carboxyl carrier protein [Candidatus Omnitrophota bacterium]MBU1888951.1 acetyl-CoA carboxylase biotin carboxyl carrier protein [Candidatus Omnitrophota bacterium]
MDLKELKKIIAIFQKAKIAELEVESEGVRFKLKKEVKERKTSNRREVPVEVISVPAQPLEQTQKQSQIQEQEPKLLEGTHEIVSPMIGTFYSSPAPDSAPFVEIGQEINEDDTVCIIEAMKIMNEIKADVKGKIIKMLAENGQPVEFGQPLFLIELPPKG